MGRGGPIHSAGVRHLLPHLCSHTFPECVRYPVMMADRDVASWAAGADPGQLMYQRHDVELLREELRRGGVRRGTIA